MNTTLGKIVEPRGFGAAHLPNFPLEAVYSLFEKAQSLQEIIVVEYQGGLVFRNQSVQKRASFFRWSCRWAIPKMTQKLADRRD